MKKKNNCLFSSFLDPTYYIGKPRVYLCLNLLITEHPTQAGLNRREMNLLTRLEIQKYCMCLLDTSAALACVASCLCPPPCAILGLASMTEKCKEERKTGGCFWNYS